MRSESAHGREGGSATLNATPQMVQLFCPALVAVHVAAEEAGRREPTGTSLAGVRPLVCVLHPVVFPHIALGTPCRILCTCVDR